MDWRLASTRELLQDYYVNLIRTHSTNLFRIAESVPQTPSATTEMVATPSASIDQSQDEDDPLDSAQPSPPTQLEADPLRLRSESSEDVVREQSTLMEAQKENEDPDGGLRKRRFSHLVEVMDSLRPRGRRRLGEHSP
jgi:hypothetical protein